MGTMNTETTRIRNLQTLLRRGALLLVALSFLASSVSASADEFGTWVDETTWECSIHRRCKDIKDKTCNYKRELWTPGPDGKPPTRSYTNCKVKKPKSSPPVADNGPVDDRRRRMAQREFSNRRDSPVMVKLLQEIVEANKRHNRYKGNEGF